MLISKAVKEAAQFEAEDKKRKEGVDARNEAEAIITQTQKAMDEAGDKVDAADKAAVETELNSLKELVDKTDVNNVSEEQTEQLKAGKQKLMDAAQKLFEKLYQAGAAAQGAAGPNPGPDASQGANPSGNPYGDDVVDGDFKEV